MILRNPRIIEEMEFYHRWIIVTNQGKVSTMELRLGDFISVGNLVVLLGIYYKMSIMLYQHKLMWKDFAARKGISPDTNGRAASGD
jgi:hypothetical protein